jgi:hypothetical protein
MGQEVRKRRDSGGWTCMTHSGSTGNMGLSFALPKIKSPLSIAGLGDAVRTWDGNEEGKCMPWEPQKTGSLIAEHTFQSPTVPRTGLTRKASYVTAFYRNETLRFIASSASD